PMGSPAARRMQMALYEHNTFIGRRIQIDGHQFRGNTFRNCVLVYGGGSCVLTENVLENVQWQFIDAAARTLFVLSSFYQRGGEGQRFVESVLTTFGKPVETAPSSSPTTASAEVVGPQDEPKR